MLYNSFDDIFREMVDHKSFCIQIQNSYTATGKILNA